MEEHFILKILRGVTGEQYWEEFPLEKTPFLNITAALMKVQQEPITCDGRRVAPVAWEQGCLEEVCGSCSMLINGKPRQGCTALIEDLLRSTGGLVVTLAPMTKFPLVRDLVVNRDLMFENLKKIGGWIETDNSLDQGFGPRIAPRLQQELYQLSTCMTCGVCSEACPQVNEHSSFIGPAAISQVRLFNSHPVGSYSKDKRLVPMMEEGGVTDCGNAQNCVQVCPKGIPLTESIAKIGRDVVKKSLADLFSLPDAHS